MKGCYDQIHGQYIKIQSLRLIQFATIMYFLMLFSYCDCFANGEFCSNCNCNNCSNNIEHESDRSKAIKVWNICLKILRSKYKESILLFLACPPCVEMKMECQMLLYSMIKYTVMYKI